jgi:hypothetical protein
VDRGVAGDVEDEVVAAGAVGPAGAGVVEDVVCPEPGDVVALGGAADPGDLGAESAG